MDGPQMIDAPALIILMPTRGDVKIETVASLHGALDGLPTWLVPGARKGVVQARNELAETALRIPPKAGVVPRYGWWVLWVDDDAFWRPKTILRMLDALKEPDIDILAGWFTGRSAYAAPKAYKADDTWPSPGAGGYEEGGIVEVARVGFHFVMHRLEVLQRVGPDPFFLLGTQERGEDLAFCARARDAGLRIWVHTGCPIAHVDSTGVAYLPGEGPMRVEGAQLQKIESTRTYDGPNAPKTFQEMVTTA